MVLFPLAEVAFFLEDFDGPFLAAVFEVFLVDFFAAAFLAATFFFGVARLAVDRFADALFFLAGFAFAELRLAFARLTGLFFLLVAISPSSSVTELAATGATI